MNDFRQQIDEVCEVVMVQDSSITREEVAPVVESLVASLSAVPVTWIVEQIEGFRGKEFLSCEVEACTAQEALDTALISGDVFQSPFYHFNVYPKREEDKDTHEGLYGVE